MLHPTPARVLHELLRAAATRSTATTRSCRSSSSTACTTGSRRCTSTASASTWAPSSTAAATARRWSSRRSSGASSCPRSSPTRRSSPRPGTPAGSTRSAVSRLALGRMERPLPRRRAPLRARRLRARLDDRDARSPAAWTSTRAAAGGRANSINFITAHDGFTLNDLVAYNDKHNEANGEGNRDGDQRQPQLELRRRGPDRRPGSQRPPRPADQELRRDPASSPRACRCSSPATKSRRTQQGNNNAYCQDNELSWFDWKLVEQNADLFRFFKQMIALRRRHPSLRRTTFLTGRPEPARASKTSAGTGSSSTSPTGTPAARALLAFTLAGDEPLEPDLHVMMNMDDSTARLRRAPRRRLPLDAVRRHGEGVTRRHRRARRRSNRSRASAAPSKDAAS